MFPPQSFILYLIFLFTAGDAGFNNARGSVILSELTGREWLLILWNRQLHSHECTSYLRFYIYLTESDWMRQNLLRNWMFCYLLKRRPQDISVSYRRHIKRKSREKEIAALFGWRARLRRFLTFFFFCSNPSTLPLVGISDFAFFYPFAFCPSAVGQLTL